MRRLNVDGYIIDDGDRWFYDWLKIPNMTLAKMRAFLVEAAGEDIELGINCMGGDVWAASSMYGELRAYKGNSQALVLGLSASASSFLMLGCSKVIAAPMAQIMMHNASSYAAGDHREMAHTAEVLKQCDETIRNAYELKTKKSREELAQYMDNETWLTAQDALTLGIIDEIDLKDGEELSAPQSSMLLASRVGNCFTPDKLHQLAQRIQEPQPNDPPNDGSEIDAGLYRRMAEQRNLFRRITTKIKQV
jgi:ATP-dependent protease ClpP protease subunit